MKNIFLTTVLFFTYSVVSAQSPILKKVKIEFEKKVNTWASLPANFSEQMKQNIPQYATSNYSYESDGTKSIYKLIPSNSQNRGGFFQMQQNENDAVYTDFNDQIQISLKSVFEKTYLLTDSIGKIQWKLTNDYREIAGFNCRRATAIIMDSVFVVAFYTTEILGEGGPESICGLPGTILGLVINRLHTTWYATKVSVTGVDVARIVAPTDKKAEKTSKLKLLESLQDRFKGNKGFGMNDDRMIWNIVI